MNSNTSTVTVWQSGRLAPQRVAPRFEFGRENWLGAGLLVLSAIVLALYVAVLEREVGRSELAHQVQRERAIAEAHCEAGQSAAGRGSCVGLFNGDEVPAQVSDANVVAVSLR